MGKHQHSTQSLAIAALWPTPPPAMSPCSRVASGPCADRQQGEIRCGPLWSVHINNRERWES